MIPKALSGYFKQLAKEETERCEDFIRHAGKCYGLRNTIPYFVRRCLLLHKNMIQRWEGTMFFGEAVTTGKEDKVNKAVILSVRPSHFLRLGHLCGEGNCFSNQGGSSTSKINLALKIPNSFVILSYRGLESINTPSLYKPDGRAWGVATADGILVSNFYMLSQHVMRHAVTKACEKAFGTKSLDEKPAIDLLTGFRVGIPKKFGSMVYWNSDTKLLVQKAG